MQKGCARGIAQITLALITLIFILIGIAFGGDKIISLIIGGQLDRQSAISEHKRQERIREAEIQTQVQTIEALRWLEIGASAMWIILNGALALVFLGASSAVALGVGRLALGRVRSTREGWAVAHARASRQLIPQTLTYSPVSHYSVKGNAQPSLPLPPLLLPSSLPPFTAMMTIPLHAPSVALLGLRSGGEQITNKWVTAKHIAVIGPTGGGKSVLFKMLIVQGLRAGHDIHILDPHFTSFDAETGEDWTPVTSCLRSQPAIQVSDIVLRLEWAVGEMKKRLQLRNKGEKYLPHIIRLVLDEVPGIVDEDDSAAGLISRILREGRKVGILLQIATQDMLAKTLGFKSGGAVRKNFSTAYIMRGCDPTSARLFIKDKEFRPNLLEVGIAGIVTEGQRGHVIARIPYASNEAVLSILAQPTAHQPLLAQPSQIHTISPISPAAPPAAPPAALPAATASKNSGGVAGESSDSGGSSAIAIAAVGGGSAKAICFSVWDVNPDVSHGAVMEIAGIGKRSTVRSYKTAWKKRGLS
jgi:hypothetical protein